MAIHLSDKPKMAFLCHFGLYEFTVLLFRLMNTPNTFQHLMHSVFHSTLDDFLLVYLDDLLVFISTVTKHEYHLRWTFAKLCEHKLFAKHKKRFFGNRKSKYLGHFLGNGKL